MVTTITLTNAARWNLDMANRVQNRGAKSEAERLNNKCEAERLRANAQQCLERLRQMGNVS